MNMLLTATTEPGVDPSWRAIILVLGLAVILLIAFWILMKYG